MKKEAAVVALGCAISATIVIGSLLRRPESPPTEYPAVVAPLPLHAWWVTFEEDRSGCGGGIHPLTQTLLWLAAHRNDDGSWGNESVQFGGRPLGKTGLTSLVLLSILGAGYLPSSKDVYAYEGGDWCLGKEIKKSLDWLRRDQRADGTFRSAADGSFDQALAAFALTEVFGLTEWSDWKRSAQLATDALLKMQKPDGSWEGAGPTAWAVIALSSARVSELTIDALAVNRALRAPADPAHPGDALAHVLLKSDANTAVFRIIYDSQERDTSNLEWWYLAANTMWAYEGISGNHWHQYKPGAEWGKWKPILRDKLLPLFEEDRSVRGTSPADALVRTSLAMLTLEIYYQYSCVFRPH